MFDFLNCWQGLPYKINPVAFDIAGFPVRYYGLAYILAFLITYKLVIYRTNNEIRFYTCSKYIQEIMTVMILGVFVGGRIGYAIFYNLDYFIKRPLEIILPINISNEIVFTGFNGMSYHGGLIGSIMAALIFARSHKISLLKISDLFVPAIPLGYTFGRLGNFMNGELYGRPTSLAIGMYFPTAGVDVLRHPSQLYEAFFEGVVIFCVLWIIKNKIFIPGFMLGVYLITYGIVRFSIEYLRQPDSHIGFVYFTLSMGQILCLPMVIIGFLMLFFLSKENIYSK